MGKVFHHHGTRTRLHLIVGYKLHVHSELVEQQTDRDKHTHVIKSSTYLRVSAVWFSSSIAASSGALIPRLVQTDLQLTSAVAITAK